MTSLVETGGQESPQIQSFIGVERIAAVLLEIREACALSREASPDLLARMDGAIALASRNRQVLVAATAVAPVGVVALYIGYLVKAYVNAGAQDARVFGRLLRDDIASFEPPVAAVEIACRRWRQKSRFLPAISELLDEVKAAKSEIANLTDFIDRLPMLRARAAKELGVD